MKKQSFEDFLKNIHAEDYHGTDDDMPDAFDNWVANELQVDDLIEYAEKWGENLIKQINNIP